MIPLRKRKRLLMAVMCMACMLQAAEAIRTWTDVQGRMITATMIEPAPEHVKVRMPNGAEFTIPLDRLIESDRQYVLRRMREMIAAGQMADVRIPPSQRVWPQSVGVSPTSVEVTVVEEDMVRSRFVYRTQDFEFISDERLARSVMTEVARTFEGTREVLLALPWGLRVQPPEGHEHFRAMLFETREAYIRAGAPPNSGGVYMSGPKIFMVPFQSLGLQRRARTWYLDRNYSNHTLIHEITHQLMDEVLPALPLWVIEGTAEYVSHLPFNAGTFRAHEHQRALRAAIEERQRRGHRIRIDRLESFMNMTHQQWHEIANRSSQDQSYLYIASLLLVYYFNHLDGDRHGTRFMQFMDAVHDDVDRREKILSDPQVERLPNGGWRGPAGFMPAELAFDRMPFNHIRLLVDGRSFEQLANEIETAFRGIGIRMTVTP
jgi:hypothetical protein